uniref:Alpha-2-macroglobulin-like 1 n=1 Tax=Cyprinus carpio TaxID=7962 RepID=A0A8C2HYT3_CYPCA
VTEESVASVSVVVQGGKTSLNKTIQILIIHPQNLLFIQSDKPIYKPGSHDLFMVCYFKCNLIPLQDPYSNRIGQWLNQTTRIGILDLSHSMSPEAAEGFYTITAWDEKNQQISHSFEIKEYVLPKYEVNIDFPSILTVQDKEVTLKVCAKYTYGKPLLGSVNAEVCGQSYGYYWMRPFPDMINVCKEYSMMTDKTGCGSQVINVTEFGLSSGGSFQVNCNVEESGTGESVKQTAVVHFNSPKYCLVQRQHGSKWSSVCECEHWKRYTAHIIFLLYKCILWSVYIVLQHTPFLVSTNALSFIKENKGELTFTLKKTAALTPYAQVVVYTVLPNGETVADSMDFPIEECLPNKVSLKFSSPTALPGERTSLNLKASPGSLCSVRAIDQSVLLLRPEAEFSAASVLGMLPVQSLSGYPYKVEEWEPNPCRPLWEIPFAEPARRKRSPFYYPYYVNRNDVYNIFRVRYTTCPPMGFGSNVEKHTQKIRKFFPETWIWDLIPVGRSGYVDVAKIVPDTITKWAAGAFCTSPVGFGVAPKTDLTAFKPFFVSLALPYSLFREEMFTLKATVFNYLPKCIMVSPLNVFTCLSWSSSVVKSQTFQWTVTPSVLGKVNITVRAEAVQSRELCGNEVVTLPDKGRVDTVMQSILVEAEGTKQSITQNELICLTVLGCFYYYYIDHYMAIWFVGDLMGRALRNIGDLLAMPYGCGEQNMLLFAPNIYILQYLENSGQLTPQIKDRAITFLESGYQRELTYKHDDGSYSAFGRTDPSGNTWLTAFVMKSFGGAKKYIFIDQANIDQAKEWLGQQQQKNGCFASVGKLFNNMLKGGVNDEVTLSAYITTALLELGVQNSDPMVVKSLECLMEASRNITNTYVTALLSYTFTLAGDEQMRQNLLSNLDHFLALIILGLGRYWTLDNNAQPWVSVEVEMSAYVLLALLSGPTLPGFGLNYSAGIVHWLSKKQNAYGGFSSTQDTVVALQALAKYSAATYNPEGSITITVTSPSGQRNQFTVNQNNRLLYQEKQLQEATGTYKLRAEGKGCAFVQVCVPLLMHVLRNPRNSSSRNESFHHLLTCMSFQTCMTYFLPQKEVIRIWNYIRMSILHYDYLSV